ncbi:hypothetical protein BHM03_00027171 [Ensete ventricosum]|uniref:Uncharacterized protein n=1 Tax=Ensete ventricosum TaxID=4639 RepID=A0A445MHH6_ENSVE|nr:hypothetical protein BHM03_00027171 [Ensete ventricosum]
MGRRSARSLSRGAKQRCRHPSPQMGAADTWGRRVLRGPTTTWRSVGIDAPPKMKKATTIRYSRPVNPMR